MKSCCKWFIGWVARVMWLEEIDVGCGEWKFGIYKELVNNVLTKHCSICGEEIKDEDVLA